ncbi:hypothetical protein [Haloglycomyces albus]|uniref:hypothetical protein n=1 Tax=Haloglycomyces albus TaxID=526067 RepID=UPI00046C92C0|nr:hypothetical protein [Haloglycomyces albus]
MASLIPRVFQGLVDDAAVFPPGNADLADALVNHRNYRNSWYADLVGPLLVPASRLSDVPALSDHPPAVGVVVDVDPAAVVLPKGLIVTHFEMKTPTTDVIARLGAEGGCLPGFSQPVFAELPFEERLPELLDAVAKADLTPKFRTGGLEESFFPSPEVLGEALWGCLRRGLGFKLTAGLHRAVRHTDPETGFVHHGFLNVLSASRANSQRELIDLLKLRDPEELTEAVTLHMSQARQHWVAFGSCSIQEPLDDLMAMSLVEEK